MAPPDQRNGGGPEGSATAVAAHRGTYLEELHVALVIALVVICIALGIVGWQLHPRSNGFQTVPQDVGVVVAGPGFGAVETLTRSGDDGATLKVSTIDTRGSVPLRDSDQIPVVRGPQAAGAAAISAGSGVTLNNKPLPSSRWAYIVLNPGTARPCATHAGYRVGTVAYPFLRPTPALVVLPPKLSESTIGDTVLPAGLCIHWDTDSPFSLSGPYLSARFPPMRGLSRAVPYTQIPQAGDLGLTTVRRVLYLLSDNTANFAIQTQPLPSVSTTTSWIWKIKDTPQVIQVAATNLSAAQHENNDAFYSGVLFGVVGGAFISLITELVVPLRGRRRRSS